jgi:hypothetical protein
MSLIELIATLAAGCMAYTTAPETIQRGFMRQLEPTALVSNIVEQYATTFAATAVHEFGHAAAAKYLSGTSSTIHLGAPFTHPGEHAPLCGNLICLDGFNPLCGTTQFHKSNDNAHQTTILLVGGLCGALAHVIAQIVKNNQLQINYGMVYQLMLALWPMEKSSDAYILWQKHFKCTDEQLEKATAMAVLVGLVACTVCSIAENRNSQNAPIHTKALLGYVNYQLNGYAEFLAIEG